MSPGESCAHPAGGGNAHHLINKTGKEITYLVVGTYSPETDHCQYPDVDLDALPSGTTQRVFSRKGGSAY